MSVEENNEIAFLERADELDSQTLVEQTVDNEFFLSIRRRLAAPGAKLLVGPRGTGKTHQMRYVYQDCVTKAEQPAAIYSSFSRYVRLEPLLKTSITALIVFQCWVIAKIALAGFGFLKEIGIAETDIGLWFEHTFSMSEYDVEVFVSQVEGKGVGSEEHQAKLNIGTLHKWFERVLSLSNRSRMIVLLDDAALSMTPEYLVEFFNLFQDLKTPKVSPKASVYPGTSQYGPRLHIRHDVQPINAWLSIEDKSYGETMDQLLALRTAEVAAFPDGVIDLFKYAAFGVPRVLLSMVRSYRETSWATPQQGVNAVIEQQYELMQAEYNSLAQKVPQFATVINNGGKLFSELAEKVAEANRAEDESRQLVVGIATKEVTTLHNRMLRFLVEVGFLYPMTSVKHGEDRTYLRFIPHIAPLINLRAFQPTQGFSARAQVKFIEREQKRQPLRLSISKLIPDAQLHLDLAACARCGTARMSDSQKFCHHCGAELLKQSAYEQCLALPIDVLPITARQKEALAERFGTIGEIIAAQDPANDLRTHGLIAHRRAATIAEKAQKFVDEYFA